MWTKGQIAFLVLDILIGVIGWIFFIGNYDAWQTDKAEGQEVASWWAATIGLWVGIVSVALLIVFALVKGAQEAKRAAQKRLSKIENSSFQIPTLQPRYERLVRPQPQPPNQGT
jgi:hypothetical protein